MQTASYSVLSIPWRSQSCHLQPPKLPFPPAARAGNITNTSLLVTFLQAYLTRRKGNKTLAVYDLTLTLKWRGSLASDEKEVKLPTGTPIRLIAVLQHLQIQERQR